MHSRVSQIGTLAIVAGVEVSLTESGGFRIVENDVASPRGMPEAAVAESVELGRHGRRRLVPAHAAVDAAVGFPRGFAVALRHQRRGPVAPGAAWFGGTDAPHVERGKGRAEMQAVARVAASGLQRRQIPDDLPDGLHMHVRRRRRHLDVPERRGHQDHPLAQLGQAVFRAVHGLVADMVAEVAEGVGEARKDLLPFELGDVLHRDQPGAGFPDKAGEVVQQQPAFVAPGRLLVVLRECLAGGASGEKRNAARPEMAGDFFRRDVGHGFVEEERVVVVLVCVAATLVEVDAHPHVDAGLAQATGQPSAAAEKIDGVYPGKLDIASRQYGSNLLLHYYQTALRCPIFSSRRHGAGKGARGKREGRPGGTGRRREGTAGWKPAFPRRGQRERRKSMAFMQTMPFSVERGMGARVMTVFGKLSSTVRKGASSRSRIPGPRRVSATWK